MSTMAWWQDFLPPRAACRVHSRAPSLQLGRRTETGTDSITVPERQALRSLAGQTIHHLPLRGYGPPRTAPFDPKE
jgi:hypothetical protein